MLEETDVEERTHRGHRPTGVAAVEAEGHRVGPLVHLTHAAVVIEVQGRVVDTFLLQETTNQRQ